MRGKQGHGRVSHTFGELNYYLERENGPREGTVEEVEKIESLASCIQELIRNEIRLDCSSYELGEGRARWWQSTN
jgi:hypothetical protein